MTTCKALFLNGARCGDGGSLCAICFSERYDREHPKSQTDQVPPTRLILGARYRWAGADCFPPFTVTEITGDDVRVVYDRPTVIPSVICREVWDRDGFRVIRLPDAISYAEAPHAR